VGRDARVFMGSGLDMSAICFPFGYQRYLVLDPPRYFDKGEDIYLLSTYPNLILVLVLVQRLCAYQLPLVGEIHSALA
jgi:hypothetical protein